MRENRPGTQPLLIAIGGFAGTGKTTLSRRLSSDLSIPRLGSDTIGRTIKGSSSIRDKEIDAYRVGYEVLFRLCEEFIESGVSVIVDVSLGWPFQWQALDSIVSHNPSAVFLPVLLRCPHEQCMARIESRYQTRPEYFDPPDVFTSDPKIVNIWNFLHEIERPDIFDCDASGPTTGVYNQVRQYIAARNSIPNNPLQTPPDKLGAYALNVGKS